jgi:hypothetical protein
MPVLILQFYYAMIEAGYRKQQQLIFKQLIESIAQKWPPWIKFEFVRIQICWEELPG